MIDLEKKKQEAEQMLIDALEEVATAMLETATTLDAQGDRREARAVRKLAKGIFLKLEFYQATKRVKL